MSELSEEVRARRVVDRAKSTVARSAVAAMAAMDPSNGTDLSILLQANRALAQGYAGRFCSICRSPILHNELLRLTFCALHGLAYDSKKVYEELRTG